MPLRYRPIGESKERVAAAERAVRWLVRFNPLLDDPSPLDAVGCRERIRQLEELRTEAASTLAGLEASGRPEEVELLTTLRQAVHALTELEQRLRRHLEVASLGEHPADLAAEIRAEEPQCSHLEWLTKPPDYLIGYILMGPFAFGWLSFTTFHASYWVADMFKTHGLAGLLLPLILFTPLYGFGWMLVYGTLKSLESGGIRLEPGKLVLFRRRLGTTRQREMELGPHSRAYVIHPKDDCSRPEIGIRDKVGDEVRFGAETSPEAQEQMVQEINRFLQANPPP